MLYHTYQSPFNQKIENPSRGRKLSFNFLLVCYLLIIRRQRTPVGDGNPFPLIPNKVLASIRRQRTPVGDGNHTAQRLFNRLYFIRRQRTPVGDGNFLLVKNFARLFISLEDREPQQGTETLFQYRMYILYYQKIENPSRGRKHN